MRCAAGNAFQLRVVATVRARRTGSRCTPHPGRKVSMLNYPQAVVIGLIQGVTELFPVSSLGHSVLVPAWVGGSWQRLVADQSAPESPYLAFIVGLHVATALALLWFFRADWARVLEHQSGQPDRDRPDHQQPAEAGVAVGDATFAHAAAETGEHPRPVRPEE